MDEQGALYHTIKTFIEAWNNPDLRSSFPVSTGPILNWYLSYARSPIKSIVDLVEHVAFTQFSSSQPDNEALCQAVMYLFKGWLSTRPEAISGGGTKIETSLQARAIRMFGRYLPQLLPDMHALFPRTIAAEEISDAVAEAVKFNFPDRIPDALAVASCCLPAIRSIPPEIMPQLTVYALCKGKSELAERFLDECPQSLSYPILKALDSFLAYEGPALLEELKKFCRSNFGNDCPMTKTAIEVFIANSLYRRNLSSTVCPKFLAATRTKLFKYFVRKSLSSPKPEMDIPSFVDAVQDLCENDEAVQDQVVVSLRALGHTDLASSFSNYFQEVSDGIASKKRARGSSSATASTSTHSVFLPERFANVKPYVPRGNVYTPELMQDDILFVDSAAIFGSSIDVIRHVELMAVRVYWRRCFKLIHPQNARQISLLVVAIPHSVFVFDVKKLLRLKDRHVMNDLAELEKVMKSDRITKIVYLPCTEERALKKGNVFSDSFKYLGNRISIRALSNHVDPSRRLSVRPSSAVRLWLNCTLPKFYRLTNWTKRPLLPDQIKFAATECHCLLDVFFKISEFCAYSKVINFEAAKSLTMKACWDTNISDTESEDDEDSEDEYDEGGDDYRKNFRPSKTASHPAPSSSERPSTSGNQHERFQHKVPAVALEPFQVAQQQKGDQDRKRRSRFEDITQQDRNSPASLAPAKRINEMARRSESVEMMRKSVIFVCSEEFVNVALELCRLEFVVHLSAADRSTPEDLVKLAGNRSYKRVIIATQLTIDSIKKLLVGSKYQVAHFVALTPEDDMKPWPRKTVEPILITAGLSSDEIACHYELRRFTLEGSPLIVNYPRTCFAVRMMRELRAEGKFNFCPAPDVAGHPSEAQLARLAGLGLLNNGNRILLIASKDAEMKLANHRNDLRIVPIPRFERFYSPGGSKKQALETKTGLTQQTAWVISELKALLPAYVLPPPQKNKLSPPRTVEQSTSCEPKRVSPVEPALITLAIPPPAVITAKEEEMDVTKLNPVKPCEKPESFADVKFLFYTENRQLATLENYLSAVGFSTARLAKATNSSSNALAMARRENRVLIVEDQFSLDQLASLGAQPGEAILLSAPDGRLLTQMRALADKFHVKDAFAALLTRHFPAKQMEPPIRLLFFGESLKCIREFLSKIPAFFDVMSYEEPGSSNNGATGPIAVFLRGVVKRECEVVKTNPGRIESAAQSAGRLERILVADMTNCAYFTKNPNVPHILLAPDRTLDLAKIFFNDLFKLPVQLLLPPFRPSSVDKLRYAVHSKQLIDFATYLKLSGSLEVRLDVLHKTFFDACAIAKRENRFLISMNTRDTSQYLFSNPNAIPQRSVLLLTEDYAKSMPLIDLAKRIFDQVAARLAS